MDSSKYRPVQSGSSSKADPEAVYEIDFPHDLPTYVLARFAGINVDAYTNFVATILLRDFRLPVKGQRHISAALGNIPMFMATDERLQFGWGQESMMRSRYIHSQGYEHACIIIALSSTFHQSYAAEVLHYMTVRMAGPRDMVPHIKQWREMIRAGNGSFTPCDFDLVVEDFIRLDPYSVGPGLCSKDRRRPVSPKLMAEALVALSKVICKKEERLTLTGGPIIAWFAAIGEYFYDLKLTVLSDRGALLHGQEFNDETQLRLIYHENSELSLQEGLSEFAGTQAAGEDSSGSTDLTAPLKFGGRVEWQGLLSKVFGRAYHHLIAHEQARVVHTAIGAAAHIFEHDQNSHAESSASTGVGFIKNITAWLPELQSGQGRMERQMKNNLEDNIEIYSKQYDILKNACRCEVCFGQGKGQLPLGGYCLPHIMETIIVLGRTISNLIVVSRLYPSRGGVQSLYFKHVARRNKADGDNTKGLLLFRSLYSYNHDLTNARRLQDAIELFSGTKVRKHIPESLAGVAHEGICAYMERLQKSNRTAVPPNRAGLITVISGAIFGKSKIYNRVSTEPVVSEEEDEDWSWEEVQLDHWSTPLYFR